MMSLRAFRDIVERVRRLSIEYGVPSIGMDDGVVLYLVVFLYVPQQGSSITVVDGGAGIGFSTIWMAKALEDSCRSSCRVIAVEVNDKRVKMLRRVIDELSLKRVSIEIFHGDFIDFIEMMPEESIDIAFIDIDKHRYLEAFRVIKSRVKRKGFVMYHNAYIGSIIERIAKEAIDDGWISTVVPTTEGILLLIKP
ncbi:O-methyltransferase family 3 [Ignisphaera aggregans DSM 17230]|uniref:O-methyltransferase family 3 n=1 Tax=Ignisphaera aggregans (strain DSM 17230 / JCM 13409 / AQ1.S1) TaxID=583356 RepID=E0SQ32_IGNAA|nr:O-methyltransferase family 3 [Ignisphaera aggregans DSM 17230]